MKTSIRNKKFTLGIVLFLVIILFLSILSAFFLYQLSTKTSAILKENHFSVVYARDMADVLTKINQEITKSSLLNRKPNSVLINNELNSFNISLQLEKNNITEIGEDKIALVIEKGFIEYRDSIKELIESPVPLTSVINLQMKFDSQYQHLMLLSQMNENAIEVKTQDAKIAAKKASIQMSIIGALCFLIAYGFTFSFASYYNERFFQLYNGIKELVSSNYNKRLSFDGKDEFYEISVAFNEMADKLNENKQKLSVTLQEDLGFNEVKELKKSLLRMKSMENQIEELISRIEKK